MISRLLPAIAFCLTLASPAAGATKPNILVIAVDDLNDWVGAFAGHPQALTPNIDRLAARGVRFENAHCQSPVCNPSRASLGVSLYPSTTGIYFLNPDILKSEVARRIPTFPHYFEDQGYAVSGAGKLFHGDSNKQHLPNWAGNFGGMGPLPPKKLTSYPGHPLWDWGAYPEKDDMCPDYKIASWGIDALKKADKDKPFLLVTGFFRPHVPQYAPQHWLDKFPLDSIRLPEVIADDLKDVSPYAIDITRLKHVAPTHEWVLQNQEWKNLVRTYLACVAFVDHQIGRVLDELEQSGHADDTIVILFSDHGFHLGEKERWAKRSLWEEGTRVPLIIAGPGIAGGKSCTKPVELIDIYPTLLELTGLKPPAALEGDSLLPLLKDPQAEWSHMARTEFGPGNYAIRSEQYRYIHYVDGSEELYDHAKDANEWENLAGKPEMKQILEAHRAHKPAKHHPILGQRSTGHDSYEASGLKLEIPPDH